MKTFTCSLLLLLSFSYLQAQESKPEFYIYYFHATHRCPTCIAVEEEMKKTLDENFKTQVEKGEIVFESYDYELSKNTAIKEKYQIWGSTLLLVKTEGGKEKTLDITNLGFMYALNNPDRYRREVSEKVREFMK